VHHAKLSLAYRCCIARMHEAVSVLNAAASVVRAGMRADTIGGIAYGAHKIAHCTAPEHHDT